MMTAVIATLLLVVFLGMINVMIYQRQEEILALLGASKLREEKTMALIDDVVTEVEENTSATESAILLLEKLSQMIADAGTDPVKLQAVRDTLDGNTRRLAEAVVAHTPAEA